MREAPNGAVVEAAADSLGCADATRAAYEVSVCVRDVRRTDGGCLRCRVESPITSPVPATHPMRVARGPASCRHRGRGRSRCRRHNGQRSFRRLRGTGCQNLPATRCDPRHRGIGSHR